MVVRIDDIRWLRPRLTGVPAKQVPWDSVRESVRSAPTQRRGTERVWLEELEEYTGTAASPLPPFVSFRWGGTVRQGNRVRSFEIVSHLSERWPGISTASTGSATTRSVWALGAAVIDG